MLRRILLFPFTFIYAIAVYSRNALYDAGILHQKKFDIPVIAIGNLSTGGAGKTPTTEYLLRLLIKKGFKPSMISRGYGRKTSGTILLDSGMNSFEIGDEPYQMMKKFPETPMAVSGNRVKGIKKVLETHPGVDVIILDDAFQHRRLKAGLNLLLTNYKKPFSEDSLLPGGNLREPKSARKRADVIVITKSLKVLSPFEERRLKEQLKPKPGQEIAFSYIKYQNPVKFKKEEELKTKEISDCTVILFTGIANPTPLEQYLERKFKEVEKIHFNDHHRYTHTDFEKINDRYTEIFKKRKILITTEKDIRRIEGTEVSKEFAKLPLYYIPIKFKFHEQKDFNFDQRIIEYVRSNKPNS